jgi:hypothetical protein
MELGLKERIFGEVISNSDENRFSLEEVLEALAREEKTRKAFIIPLRENENSSIDMLSRQNILVEEEKKQEKPNIILYEFLENTYYVYSRKKKDEKDEGNDFTYSPNAKTSTSKEEHSYGLFIPTGVVVRRVPQNILGNGVLGRAFIHQNYIEVLDSLVGNEYTEVLTHEVFHIMYPDKHELEIRNMTKNYVGDKAVYH